MADFIYAGDGGAFKTCTKCGETKAINEFARDKCAPLGAKPKCKSCIADYSRSFRGVISPKEKGIRFTCAGCGCDDIKRGYTQKYCSECSVKNKNRFFNKAVKVPKPCVTCGQVFTPFRVTVKECESCRHDRNKADQRRIMRDRRLDQDYVKSCADYRKTESYKELRRAALKRWRSTKKAKFENAVKAGFRRGLKEGAKAGRKTFDLLGYTADELRTYIEAQFEPGMSWNNHGEWHVDHIIPLSACNYDSPDDIDFKKAWALENLRPLWAEENLKKNAKLIAPFQPSLKLKVQNIGLDKSNRAIHIS